MSTAAVTGSSSVNTKTTTSSTLYPGLTGDLSKVNIVVAFTADGNSYLIKLNEKNEAANPQDNQILRNSYSNFRIDSATAMAIVASGLTPKAYGEKFILPYLEAFSPTAINFQQDQYMHGFSLTNASASDILSYLRYLFSKQINAHTEKKDFDWQILRNNIHIQANLWSRHLALNTLPQTGDGKITTIEVQGKTISFRFIDTISTSLIRNIEQKIEAFLANLSITDLKKPEAIKGLLENIESLLRLATYMAIVKLNPTIVQNGINVRFHDDFAAVRIEDLIELELESLLFEERMQKEIELFAHAALAAQGKSSMTAAEVINLFNSTILSVAQLISKNVLGEITQEIHVQLELERKADLTIANTVVLV